MGADVCLPAGPGLLLCLPIAGPDLEGKVRLVARANTWITAQSAEPDQRAVGAAVDPVHSVLAAAVRPGDERGEKTSGFGCDSPATREGMR